MNKNRAKRILDSAFKMTDAALEDAYNQKNQWLTQDFLKSRHAKTMIQYLMCMSVRDWETTRDLPKRDRTRTLHAFLEVTRWMAIEHLVLKSKR